MALRVGLADVVRTGVSCGIAAPTRVEGQADYIPSRGAAPWDQGPGSLRLAEVGGFVGTGSGRPYLPRDNDTGGLIPAASRAAYDMVLHALRRSGGLEDDRGAVPSE